MNDTTRRTCPVCGQGEPEPYRSGCIAVKDAPISPVDNFVAVELYRCSRCRYLAMFAPITQAEAFQQEQEVFAAITDPVEQFEYRFRDYSEKQLQRVIDGRDYVPAAKKAAQRLLYRKKYGQ